MPADTIFALTSGAASKMVSAKLKPHDLSPKQLQWCRRHLGWRFREAERVASRVQREAQRARERMEAGNANA